MRLLGIIGVVDALIVPVLLVRVLLFGSIHGFVQATYLLIALDVFGFTQAMNRRYRHLTPAGFQPNAEENASRLQVSFVID